MRAADSSSTRTRKCACAHRYRQPLRPGPAARLGAAHRPSGTPAIAAAKASRNPRMPPGCRQRRRRHRRQQPRRPPARRRAVQHRGPAGDRGRGRIEDRGPPGQRHPSRPGRAEGGGTRRPRPHIGRAFLYGQGAMGEAGVTKALEIIHKELDTTMAFCGHTDVRRVDRRIPIGGQAGAAGWLGPRARNRRRSAQRRTRATACDGKNEPPARALHTHSPRRVRASPAAQFWLRNSSPRCRTGR